MDDLAAISGSAASLRTLADGTVRLSIDVEPRYSQQAMKLFGAPGTPIALARMTEEAAVDDMARGVIDSINGEPAKGKYSGAAKELARVGFNTQPEVLALLGSDADYQEYCRGQKCIVCRDGDWDQEKGELRNQPMHVRRAGESGTAHKGQFCTVPGCSKHHRFQHDRGYTAAYLLAVRMGNAAEQPEYTADGILWFESKLRQSLHAWSWDKMRKKFGVASMTDCDPMRVLAWAVENGVSLHLPANFGSAK